MRAGLVMAMLAGAVALGGCARIASTRLAQAEVNLPYRTNLARGEDGAFAVTVRARGASLEQVRESVRHRATGHCLTTRGNSDTIWTTDPATGDWAYTVRGEDLVFDARCRA